MNKNEYVQILSKQVDEHNTMANLQRVEKSAVEEQVRRR